MPPNLRTGQKVKSFQVQQLLNKGAMAISYEAMTVSGERVFIKLYKSPTITVDWYPAYIAYQAELKRRVQTSHAERYCYQMIDFFEADVGCKCYFQAFEFFERGKDLRKFLETADATLGSAAWAQRLIFAKLLITGISALHDAKIIHSDLKPENVFLKEDKTIKAGYQLKLVDMDYSVLSDKKAPWHGYQGYVGTDFYYSPEHIKGGVPQTASDVFTCGLILYELLGGGHPYRGADAKAYADAVRSYSAPVPKLGGTMHPAVDNEVVTALRSCLNPDPSKRPTAGQIAATLKGHSSTVAPPTKSEATKPSPEPAVSPAAPEVSPPPPPPAPVPPPEPAIQVLALISGTGASLKVRIRTEFGRSLAQSFGDDSKYLSGRQFILEKNSASEWQVVPIAGATNETLVNGRSVTGPTSIKNGDVLAIGREAKGIIKLPMQVQIG